MTVKRVLYFLAPPLAMLLLKVAFAPGQHREYWNIGIGWLCMLGVASAALSFRAQSAKSRGQTMLILTAGAIVGALLWVYLAYELMGGDFLFLLVVFTALVVAANTGLGWLLRQ